MISYYFYTISCSLHLRGDDHAPQHSATNAHVAGERALLVDEVPLLSLLGYAATDILLLQIFMVRKGFERTRVGSETQCGLIRIDFGTM